MDPMIELATRLQAFGLLGSAFLIVIKATLILLIVRLMIAAVPRASAASKHLAITIALCSVVALPLVTVIAPAWLLGVLPSPVDNARQPNEVGSTGDDQEEVSGFTAAINVAKASGVVRAERISAMSAFLSTIRNSWQGLVLIFLGFISALFLGRIALGVLGVRAVARRATDVDDDAALLELDRACDYIQLNRNVRLLRSADVSVPVVWGLFTPILLLPASSTEWTMERLRVVLLHELAHVKRGDGFTLLITKAAVAIFWFHPLMWTLETAARSECERACDDLVLAGGTKASDYAEHLLSIAKALPQADPFKSVTLAMSRRSQLEGRLLSILQPHIRRGSFSSRYVGIVAVFALFLIVPLASVRLVAAPQKDTQIVAEKEPIVEIESAVAAKMTPEMVLAQFDKLKHGKDSKWMNWGVDSKRTPRTGKEWYEFAYEMHREDKYPEAIKAFNEAIVRKYKVDASMYNIACGYALMGDADNATKWLRDAIDHGWDNFGHIGSDSDFDPIRATPQFAGMVEELKVLIRERGDDEDSLKELTERVDETNERLADLKQGASRDGDEWFGVGLDLLRLRKIDESIAAFKKAIDLDAKTSTSMYNLACAYSLKGDANTAISWLGKAIENGFDSVEKMQNDPDLQNARRHPQFAQMITLSEDLQLHRGQKNWIGKWFNDDDADAWRTELPEYREQTRKHPNVGRTWFNLGYAQLQAGEEVASAESFQKALSLGYRPGTSAYNTACAYAKAGRIDDAFAWLDKARSMGFKLHNYLEGDDDLENLRDDPRYRTLRQEVRAEKRRDDEDK
ncbi:MAG: TPR end-of-group domain-containing protein [Thermoanaerobaculia bacterium]